MLKYHTNARPHLAKLSLAIAHLRAIFGADQITVDTYLTSGRLFHEINTTQERAFA